MHIGLGLTMQNLDGQTTDAEVYQQELGLAAQAESAGFDSVWFSEHHFSDYQLTPQTPMVLSWLAGQTQRIKLGQKATVLPWHDPVRVAESYSVLDHLSGGRAIAGLGRVEFNNFRLEMGESRRRFAEYYDALANNIAKHGMERFNGFLADLQVWGAPDEVTEKLLDYVRRCDAGALVIDVTFGDMPYDEARANFDLFGSEVLPELHRHDVGGDIGVSYGARLQEAPSGV